MKYTWKELSKWNAGWGEFRARVWGMKGKHYLEVAPMKDEALPHYRGPEFARRAAEYWGLEIVGNTRNCATYGGGCVEVRRHA